METSSYQSSVKHKNPLTLQKVPELHSPREYRYIRVWGKYLGSFEYFISEQQEQAAKENAPINAIYRGDNGQWRTFDEVTSEMTKHHINEMMLYPRNYGITF